MITQEITENAIKELHKVIIGQESTLRMLLCTYFTGGHLLFEGVPGLAKTLMVRALARITGKEYKRIQFTPDLLPSDVLGTNVFNPQSGNFELRKGAIFTEFLLADEINRTPPKTQSALLEAMEERQVTIDSVSYKLASDFTVYATQNPIEFEGTYPLPEAQLDRFMVKLTVNYPSENEEVEILERYHKGFNAHNIDILEIGAIFRAEDLLRVRNEIKTVVVKPEVIKYINQIVRATRNSALISVGASPRAGIALLLLSKSFAAMLGYDYVTPDHILELVVPVMRHRLILTPEAEIDEDNIDGVIQKIVKQIDIPR